MMEGAGARRREIDAIKGAAIIGVILGHAFSYSPIEGAIPSIPPFKSSPQIQTAGRTEISGNEKD